MVKPSLCCCGFFLPSPVPLVLPVLLVCSPSCCLFALPSRLSAELIAELCLVLLLEFCLNYVYCCCVFSVEFFLSPSFNCRVCESSLSPVLLNIVAVLVCCC